MVGFDQVDLTEGCGALKLVGEVTEVGEGETVKHCLGIEVTEVSTRPQASGGLWLKVEGT